MTNELINKRGIKVSEMAAISELLSQVNGRASRFTLCALNVELVAERAEEALDERGLPQRLRIGVTVRYVPRGPSAAAYKYAAKSTEIVIRRFSEGWRLMQADTIYVSPRDRERFEIAVSKAAAEYIRKASVTGLKIAA